MMNALGMHTLFFVFTVALGCGTLSIVVRLMARSMSLEFRPSSAVHLMVSLAGIAFAGFMGQALFALFHERQVMASLLARLVGWVTASTLATLATSLSTPYMPRGRSIWVGALSGLAGWAAFSIFLTLSGESISRIASVLAFWGVLPLAVLFPLPVRVSHACANCTCDRDQAPALTLAATQAAASPVDAAPLTSPRPVSIADLIGEIDNTSLPGRVPIGGRVVSPSARSVVKPR